MPKYRYVGDHAETAYKGDQAIPLAPGDFVELSNEDMKNAENKELALIPADEKGGK